MEEYIQGKRRNAADFQLRMCKVDFNQHCMSKQRKSYQEIQERKIKIHFKELCTLFVSSKDHDLVMTDEEKCVLQKAFTISKSVPRRSGRNYWKEQAGYAPSMMTMAKTSGVLLKEDLVFYRAIDESVEFYIVQKYFNLSEINKKVEVSKIGNKEILKVSPDRFLLDKGMIATVPSQFYSILEDETVQIEDSDVEDLLVRLREINSEDVSDEVMDEQADDEQDDDEQDPDFSVSQVDGINSEIPVSSNISDAFNGSVATNRQPIQVNNKIKKKEKKKKKKKRKREDGEDGDKGNGTNMDDEQDNDEVIRPEEETIDMY